MNEKLTPNNFENEDYIKSNSDADYKNLIDRLREIKKNIALLEKTIFR